MSKKAIREADSKLSFKILFIKIKRLVPKRKNVRISKILKLPAVVIGNILVVTHTKKVGNSLEEPYGFTIEVT
jgi:hypothetical protein